MPNLGPIIFLVGVAAGVEFIIDVVVLAWLLRRRSRRSRDWTPE